jgi:hypothetical protein
VLAAAAKFRELAGFLAVVAAVLPEPAAFGDGAFTRRVGATGDIGHGAPLSVDFTPIGGVGQLTMAENAIVGCGSQFSKRIRES